ncbi:Lrp/AsnC family transcriptional regulator [Roseibium salinum]|nr:Lrp/AsnC family transcriptional regulator [Roseibium salinum]
MTYDLSELDRTLINSLQDDLPLTSHPFAVLADELKVSEQEVVDRIRRLRDDGILTRFGPFFSTSRPWAAPFACAPWPFPTSGSRRS